MPLLAHPVTNPEAYKKSLFSGYNCSRLAESLTVPVSYILGSDAEVLSHVPPAGRNDATPGYVQFKALNPRGVPNALCPGIK